MNLVRELSSYFLCIGLKKSNADNTRLRIFIPMDHTIPIPRALLTLRPYFSTNPTSYLIQTWAPHECLILTKFYNHWVKIVDFLLKAYAL